MNKNINKIKNLTIAHRGIYNNLNIPENSLKAFKKALTKKIPIELDIHLTKDNKLVVFHDSNINRMTNINKMIKNCTLEDINNIKLLNTDEKIPLLTEVLELINEKVLIDIEIKDDKRFLTTTKLLTEILDNYKGDFIIQSFYLKYIYWFKKNRPNYICGLLITNVKNFCYQFIDNNFILKILKPDFIAYNKTQVFCPKIQIIRKKRIIILAWTIKNKKEKIESLKYVDSLISEYFE